MVLGMRRKIIAGNWKMNKTPSEAVKLIEELKPLVKNDDVDVVFCVPAVSLMVAIEAVKGTDIAIGAQNMYFEESGAFTGEISPSMLTEIGVKYVILGHSERRGYFNETDDMIGKKVAKAIEHKLIPIICCGETLGQRETCVTLSVVERQVKAALKDISAENVEKCIIAYEPIWAIGTGKVATSAQAEEVCAYIRNVIKETYGEAVADIVRIQYGGSVTAASAKEIFEQPNIDGGLVGGASLKPDFGKIVNYDK